jgi:hypothetical protein
MKNKGLLCHVWLIRCAGLIVTLAGPGHSSLSDAPGRDIPAA